MNDKTLIFILCCISVYAGVITLSLLTSKAQIEFIYSEWARNDKYKDECIDAARNNLPPPAPPGRIIREGMEPIRPRD